MQGIYFGRFQPSHLQHLTVVSWVRTEFPEVPLTIGVANWLGERSQSNFMNGDEASQVFKLSLKDRDMSEVSVVTVDLRPDVSLRDSIYSSLSVNNITHVFSGSDKTLEATYELAKELNTKLKIFDLRDSGDGVRATDLRNWMMEGSNKWEQYVMPSAVKYMKENNVIERLRGLGEGNKRPWVEGWGRSLNSSSERR